MSVVIEKDSRIEVICQFTRDALIIPIKLKITDEDGVSQEYVIKAYKESPFGRDTILPNGVHVKSHLRIFDCQINSFGKTITLRIFFNAKECLWKIAPKL